MSLKDLLPYPVRVELARMKRLPAWVLERGQMARRRAPAGAFDAMLAAHGSPLRREGLVHDEALQRGKEKNVARAAELLDGVVVGSCGVFSYHHVVGRPSRLRGFAVGLELHDAKPARGVGGGCCQVSNLLYWLALAGGMKIVERHRHALDLFPDAGRTVPFGCGATVFYNYADLRFENPLPCAVRVGLWIEDGFLRGELRAEAAVPWRVEIREEGHRFFREGDAWMRENRIRRRFLLPGGGVLRDEEIAHNVARVLYEPPAAEIVEAA